MKKMLCIGLVLLLPHLASADEVDNALSLLEVPVFKVRAQACLALGARTTDARRIVGAITKALKDKHPAVRTACAIALGKLKAIESASGLAAAMSDGDKRVSRMAERSLDRVIKTWVARRDFRQHRFNFYVAGLRADGEFKDLVIERLLEHENVGVGVRASFDEHDDEPPPSVELALHGELKAIDGRRAQLQITLRLNGGDYVLKSWKRVVATGKTPDDTLSNAASMAVGRVLGYLGARRR